ncbi:MAG: redoxin domain-containing protein [Gemmatimonadaceae bacterium]
MTSALRVGDLLPVRELASVDGRSTVALRDTARGATALIFVHGIDCNECRAYAASLAPFAESFRWWAGTPLVVVPDVDSSVLRPATSHAQSLRVVVDRDGVLARSCGVAPGAAAIIVADRWGQIYHVAHAGDSHDFLAPEELESWFRYLATQCPECGVIDEPNTD